MNGQKSEQRKPYISWLPFPPQIVIWPFPTRLHPAVVTPEETPLVLLAGVPGGDNMACPEFAEESSYSSYSSSPCLIINAKVRSKFSSMPNGGKENSNFRSDERNCTSWKSSCLSTGPAGFGGNPFSNVRPSEKANIPNIINPSDKNKCKI